MLGVVTPISPIALGRDGVHLATIAAGIGPRAGTLLVTMELPTLQ